MPGKAAGEENLEKLSQQGRGSGARGNARVGTWMRRRVVV